MTRTMRMITVQKFFFQCKLGLKDRWEKCKLRFSFCTSGSDKAHKSLARLFDSLAQYDILYLLSQPYSTFVVENLIYLSIKLLRQGVFRIDLQSKHAEN